MRTVTCAALLPVWSRLLRWAGQGTPASAARCSKSFGSSTGAMTSHSRLRRMNSAACDTRSRWPGAAEQSRHFTTLSDAEEENGQRRIYLGIHWSSTNQGPGPRPSKRSATRVVASCRPDPRRATLRRSGRARSHTYPCRRTTQACRSAGLPSASPGSCRTFCR
jgi:hypothetical protein